MSAIARNPQKIWRVIDLLKWGEQYFSDNDFDNPRKEIEILLQKVLECNRVDLYLQFEEPLGKNQLKILREWVQRRKNREPIQYITGNAGFYNLVLNVTPDVLIPRPESERLVETLLSTVAKDEKISILDIGTGSGCLALSIGKELPHASILGIDNSKKAISLSKLNAAMLEIGNVNFKEMDFLNNTLKEKIDIIISNPPYIPKKEMASLMPEVNMFEPHSALTDSDDGLTFYHKIAEISQNIINANGWIFLEVGLGEHPNRAKQIFMNDKFKNVELIKDYNGDDRVLKVQVV